MKTRIVIALLLIFSAPGVLTASDGAVWSLQRSIDHALRNNLDLRQQRLNEDRGRVDLQRSYANLFPTLGGVSSQGFNYGRTIDPFTNEFATERVLVHNFNGYSDMVLFSGFQNINAIRASIHRNTALRYDTQRLQNDIILAITAAYLQILYHEEMVVVAEEQMEVINLQMERSRIMFEGGSISRGNLLEVEAQQAQEELVLLNARNALQLSYLELIQLLDLDPEQPFMVEPLSVEADARTALQEPEIVVQRALTVEPSVLAAKSRLSMARRDLAWARGGYSPRLTFGAQVGSGYSEAALRRVETENGPVYERKPYADQISDNFNTFVRVTLQVPIFNRLQVRQRVSLSRIDIESAQIGYEQRKNQLSKLIYQAHSDALAAWQRYVATQKSGEAFDEAFRFARQAFDQGMINAIDYNEARVRQARAQANLLQSKYEYLFKQRVLDFYQGEELGL